jgi:hypothetical protein
MYAAATWLGVAQSADHVSSRYGLRASLHDHQYAYEQRAADDIHGNDKQYAAIASNFLTASDY